MKSICATLLSAVFLLSLSPASAQDGEAPTNQDLLERIEGVERLLDEQEEVIQKQVTINNDQKILIDKLKDSLLPNIQPVGSLIFMASEQPPAGYLYCDGSVRSRTEYGELFAAIGTTWGRGDGSTTFNLPDLRGEFIRVWSKGHSVDSGRRVGQAQGQSTRMPNTEFKAADAGNHGHILEKKGGHDHSTDKKGDHDHSTDTKGNHNHRSTGSLIYRNSSIAWDSNWRDESGGQHDSRAIFILRKASSNYYTTNQWGSHDHKTNLKGNHDHKTSYASDHDHPLTKEPDHHHNITGGDAETRPRNQALACYIKAFSHSAF